MATPRSNSICTLESQEVGKLTLPRFSSCWLDALPVSAMVMRLAAIVRYFGFMVGSPMENARARDRTCTFAPAKKTSCTVGVNGLPTASALPALTERRFRHVPFQRAALCEYTLSTRLCGRPGAAKEAILDASGVPP